MSTVDFSRVNELAKKYEPEMTRFLRDMIRIPSESCQEEGVIRRIKEEMEKGRLRQGSKSTRWATSSALSEVAPHHRL